MKQLNLVDEGKMFLIKKPFGWTSFQVVKKIRSSLKLRKVGHAGTLDPCATGLLILCSGKLTKTIETFQLMEKEYTGCFIIGSTTPSFDLETEPRNHKLTNHITKQIIYDTAKSFTGMIEQVPPAYSAIKTNGKRAYSEARKGKVLELKPRTVEIKSFEIVEISIPKIKFKIVCSKGTYIRSIARDFGEKLEVGAYLSELCRTRIGQYSIKEAQEINSLLKNENIQ